ncbi:hypothetical protein DSECCO2_653970 [anaerobic digester metagenome]
MIIISRESTFLSFIRLRIIRGPIPAKLILDNPNPWELLGSIMPNILPIISLSLLALPGFLITFKPQKVKNMVTFLPVAAAPLAITNEARARSRSSLNTIRVLFLPPPEPASRTLPPPFCTEAMIFLPAELTLSSLFPVILHQAGTSLAKPGSLAVIFRTSPSDNRSISFLSRMMGPGHCRPLASTSTVLLSAFGAAASLPW